MRNKYVKSSILPLLVLFLSGCSPDGGKATNISIVYATTAIISLLLLAGYCAIEKQKDPWYLLLFTSVLIVNIGYFALSISGTLEEALLANRLAYFGSVFLPPSMCMIILNVTRVSCPKWLPAVLLSISAAVFFIASSPGYLDIYYKEVTLEQINGVSVLNKVYGPLHSVYWIYLLGYFSVMVAVIIYATWKGKISSVAHALLLTIAVFVNIGVWLIEQFVSISLEVLSVSYIISECFLLGLHLLIAESEKRHSPPEDPVPPEPQTPLTDPAPENPAVVPVRNHGVDPAQIDLFAAGLRELTPKEQAIFQCYVDGMTTAEIMEKLNIKENTLKFHNKNLYSKLSVSSRKQLLTVYRDYSDCQRKNN